MLEMVIRKARLATLVDDVRVVTPDEAILRLCTSMSVTTFLHSGPRDVLKEYYDAATDVDIIVRLTADCPLVRPGIIDDMVHVFEYTECDLAYNTRCDTNMEGDGLDVEVFSYEALEKAHLNATGDEREHVTKWMRNNLSCLYVPPPKFDGCSVNTPEEYDRVCRIIN